MSYADQIRAEPDAYKMRELIADGIEENKSIADSTNSIAQEAKQKVDENDARINNIITTQNGQTPVEVIDAHHSNVTQRNFNSVGARMDDHDTTLADIAYNAKIFGLKSDGKYYDTITQKYYKDDEFIELSTNDSVNIQNAVDSIPKHSTLLLVGDIVFRESVILSKPITIKATRGKARIKSDVSMSSAFKLSEDVDIKDVHIEGVEFEGGVIDEGEYPRRSRNIRPSMTSAISCVGDLNSGTHKVNNLKIYNCGFYNIESLPVYILGVRGITRFEKCEVDNCLDVGFIDNENVIACYNYITKSADNGISLSRGNKTVTCIANITDLCCYSGIWLAGYDGEDGPEDFTCIGNTIKRSGMMGINLRTAPKKGIITGNTIDTVYRGGIDKTQVELSGDGMYIADNNSTGNSAELLQVYGNNFINCERGGMTIQDCKHLKVFHNYITDVGTTLDDSGNPVDLTATTSQNYGIKLIGTNDNVELENNTVTDTRSTPLTVFPIIYSSTNTNCTSRNNSSHRTIKDIDDGVPSGFEANGNVVENHSAHKMANAAITNNSLLLNPFFENWRGVAPDGISRWTLAWGEGLLKDNVNVFNGSNAIKMIAPANTVSGLVITDSFKSNLADYQYLTAEITFMLKDGSLSGAGLFVDWNYSDTSYRSRIKLEDYVTNPELNKWYTITVIVVRKGKGATFTGYKSYFFSNHDENGIMAYKTLVLDKANIKVATDSEVKTLGLAKDGSILTNFNTNREGSWYISNVGNILNKPENITNGKGFLEVIKYNDDILMQRLTMLESSNVFVRSYDGIWTAWTQL